MAIQVQLGLKTLIEDLVKRERGALDDECNVASREYKDRYRAKAMAFSEAKMLAQKLYDTCFPANPETPVAVPKQMTQEEHGKWCMSLKPGDPVIVRHKDWNKQDKECWYENKVLFANDQVIGIHSYVLPRQNGVATVGLDGQTSQVAIFPIDDPMCSEELKRYSLGLIVQHWAKVFEWRVLPISQVSAVLDAIKG